MTTSHARSSTSRGIPACGAKARRCLPRAVALGLRLSLGLPLGLAACASAEAPPAPVPSDEAHEAPPARAARADDAALREAGPDPAYAPAAPTTTRAPGGAIAAGEARGDRQAPVAADSDAAESDTTSDSSRVIAKGGGVARAARLDRPTRHQWLPFPIAGRRVIAEPTLRGLPGGSADVVPRVLGEPLPEPEPPIDAAGRPTIPIGDASTPYAPRQAN